VATYQAASGAGAAAMDELYEQTRVPRRRESEPEHFAHRIAFNCIPQIDVFLDDGSTKEEWKMVAETKKIMHAPGLAVMRRACASPCCAVTQRPSTIEFERPVTLAEARRVALEKAPGITVLDDPSESRSTRCPHLLEGSDDTYIGRLRTDPTVANGLAMWVVADQLRKGAALNTVQIAESLLGQTTK
jgi:aspartate-semialdehyde dehydrogenase